MTVSKWATHSRAVVLAALVLFAFTWTACDGDGDGDLTDAELIVGSWGLAAVTDSNGDQLATFNANYSDFDASFDAAGNVTIALESATANPDIGVAGTYAVDESAGSLGITTVVSGTPITIPFSYNFDDDDTIELSANALLLGQVLQTSLTGTATVTLARQ